MNKNNVLRNAALMLPASAALLTACSDDDAEPKKEATRNGDGKYNIIFITCDQEAYMEEPAGCTGSARRTDTGRSRCLNQAGNAALCKTPADLVPPTRERSLA